ncbi:MAG TPA: hypothetical protein VM529_25015 [Gemmata sp.]|jgi:hypothetical protein|nr:hypothetical protein [Gemmata sp.]
MPDTPYVPRVPDEPDPRRRRFFDRVAEVVNALIRRGGLVRVPTEEGDSGPGGWDVLGSQQSVLHSAVFGRRPDSFFSLGGEEAAAEVDDLSVTLVSQVFGRREEGYFSLGGGSSPPPPPASVDDLSVVLAAKAFGGRGETLADQYGAGNYFPVPLTFVLGVGTGVTTGTNKTNVLEAPFAGKIVKAWMVAKTGPTGAALIVDINKNGSTIWATQANRVRIAAGATEGTETSFDTTTFAAGDNFTIDVDQIGSTEAGQDVTVVLSCLMRNG